jgi:hypothetical protein
MNLSGHIGLMSRSVACVTGEAGPRALSGRTVPCHAKRVAMRSSLQRLYVVEKGSYGFD